MDGALLIMEKKRLGYPLVVGVWLTFSLLSGGIHAAQEDSQARALAKARYILKQLKAENQRLLAEKGDLETRLDEADEKLKEIPVLKKKLKERAERLKEEKRTAKSYERKYRASDKRLAKTTEQLKALVNNFKEHREALRMVVAERNQLEGEKLKRQSALDACEFKNEKLYRANVEMGERYENKNCRDSLFQHDSLTGLKQVEVETLLEEYQRKLEGLRVSR